MSNACWRSDRLSSCRCTKDLYHLLIEENEIWWCSEVSEDLGTKGQNGKWLFGFIPIMLFPCNLWRVKPPYSMATTSRDSYGEPVGDISKTLSMSSSDWVFAGLQYLWTQYCAAFQQRHNEEVLNNLVSSEFGCSP